MVLSRRGVLAAAPAVAVAGIGTASADDDFTTTDLAVSCDDTVAPALRRVAAAFRRQGGVRVRIFPTGPNLLLPQLHRDIQNDIILTRLDVIDAARKDGLVKPGGRAGPWRDRLMIAEAATPEGPDGSYAVPDPTPGSVFDGPALLKAMNVTSDRIVGVLNTDAVVWALLQGEARRGVVFQTDIVAHEGIRAVAPVPDSAWPPVLYGATLTTLAYRIDPQAFVSFLGSPAGMAELKAGGLEPA